MNVPAASTQPTGGEQVDDESHIEALLSEYLMGGWELLDDGSCCPVCATPLMKSLMNSGGIAAGENKENDATISTATSNSTDHHHHVLVESVEKGSSAAGIVQPGVPYCVLCKAYVYAQGDGNDADATADILASMEAMSEMQEKGSILLNLPKEEGTAPSRGIIEDKTFTTTGAINSIKTMPSEIGVETGQDAYAAHLHGVGEEAVQNVADPSHIKDGPHVTESFVEDYTVRRDIATKVLGAKMLQGYTLKEDQCLKCNMPLMELNGSVDCVVCPVLAKRAKKKKMQEQERIAKAELEVLEEAVALKNAKLQQEAELTAIKTSSMSAFPSSSSNKDDQSESADEAIKAAKELLVLAELRAIAHARLEEENKVEAAEKSYAYLRKMREEEEAAKINPLVSDAERKAIEAERAIEEAQRAREALEIAKKQAWSDSLKTAEADCLAEVESVCSMERKGNVVEEVQEQSEEQKAHWNFLRSEASMQMSRRMLQGWTLTEDFCGGMECGQSPLLMLKSGPKYCVICGGSGTGVDGAYSRAPQSKPRMSISPEKAEQMLNNKTPEEKARRNMASGEIGKRMLSGWSLLENPCPLCNIPIMTLDNKTECVLCGPVDLTRKKRNLSDEERLAASSEIGRRMLSGWSMQGQPCLFCDIPLMKNVEGIEECVLCGDVSELKKAKNEKEKEKEEKRKNLTTEIGKRVMDGWTLSHEYCQTCTDVRYVTKGNEKECLICGPVEARKITLDIPANFDFNDPRALQEFLAQVQQKQGLAPTLAPSPTMGGAAAQSHYQSQHPGVADKSRMGWTILPNATCDCGGPMMRPINTRGAVCVTYTCDLSCYQDDAEAIQEFNMENEMMQAAHVMGAPPKPVRSPHKQRFSHSPSHTMRSMNSNGRYFTPPRPRNMVTGDFSPVPVSYVGVEHYGGYTDEGSVLSEDSRARTVASDALGAIMNRIEVAKAQLMSPVQGRNAQEEIANQKEMADLIEKLASAAVMVKNLEKSSDEHP